jgi:hypothetical protein
VHGDIHPAPDTHSDSDSDDHPHRDYVPDADAESLHPPQLPIAHAESFPDLPGAHAESLSPAKLAVADLE